MEGITLAVQLYSVRSEMAKDFLGTLKTVKDMGYEGVEMYGNFPMSPEKIRDGMAEAGLKLVGWHTAFQYLQADCIEATIAYHKITGCPTLVCPWIPTEYTQDIAGWEKAAEIINAASDRLIEEGIYTGYHNHSAEFKPLGDSNAWGVFFSKAKPEVIMQIDTGNAMMGGGKPMEELRKFPGRSQNVHLKPFSSETKFSTMIGKDDTDWKALFDLCINTGGTKCFIVEYEDKELYTPFEGVKACREALREFGF